STPLPRPTPAVRHRQPPRCAAAAAVGRLRPVAPPDDRPARARRAGPRPAVPPVAPPRRPRLAGGRARPRPRPLAPAGATPRGRVPHGRRAGAGRAARPRPRRRGGRRGLTGSHLAAHHTGSQTAAFLPRTPELAMIDIHHRIGIAAPQEDVHRALATTEGVA